MKTEMEDVWDRVLDYGENCTVYKKDRKRRLIDERTGEEVIEYTK